MRPWVSFFGGLEEEMTQKSECGSFFCALMIYFRSSFFAFYDRIHVCDFEDVLLQWAIQWRNNAANMTSLHIIRLYENIKIIVLTFK